MRFTKIKLLRVFFHHVKAWQHLVTGVGGGARAAPREGVRGRRRRRWRPPDPRPAPRPRSSFEHRITFFLIH